MTSTHTLEHVREIVRQFSVYYEVRPESMLLHDHTIRQVGFCVDLYGRDGQGPFLCPGDERSKEIYRGLREIALQIVPEEQEDCRYQLDDFDASLHYDSHGSKYGRVQLKIHILHKDGFQQPIDAGETRARREMEDRLRNLGIYRG
jgi:hypothetical protein